MTNISKNIITMWDCKYRIGSAISTNVWEMCNPMRLVSSKLEAIYIIRRNTYDKLQETYW